MPYSSEEIPSHRLVITPMNHWRDSRELYEVRTAALAAQIDHQENQSALRLRIHDLVRTRPRCRYLRRIVKRDWRVWDGVQEPRSILMPHETNFQSRDLAPLNGSTLLYVRVGLKGGPYATSSSLGRTDLAKLREAEVALCKGQSAWKTCRALSITEQTYYR
jgi:hypothetical protein